MTTIKSFYRGCSLLANEPVNTLLFDNISLACKLARLMAQAAHTYIFLARKSIFSVTALVRDTADSLGFYCYVYVSCLGDKAAILIDPENYLETPSFLTKREVIQAIDTPYHLTPIYNRKAFDF